MKAILWTTQGEHVATREMDVDPSPDVIKFGDRLFVEDDGYGLIDDPEDEDTANYVEAVVVALPQTGRQGE